MPEPNKTASEFHWNFSVKTPILFEVLPWKWEENKATELLLWHLKLLLAPKSDTKQQQQNIEQKKKKIKQASRQARKKRKKKKKFLGQYTWGSQKQKSSTRYSLLVCNKLLKYYTLWKSGIHPKDETMVQYT